MTADLRRSAALVGTLLAVSASGHVSGGGATPTPAALTVTTMLAVLLTVLLGTSRRPPSVRTLGLSLGGFQVVAHGLFHHLTGAAPLPNATLAAVHGAHTGHTTGVPLHLVADHAGHVAHAATHGVSPLMVTSHLLATVLLAWLFGPATAQIRAVLTPRIVVLAPITRSARAPWTTPDLPPRLPHEVAAALTRRGPPVRFACA